MDIVRKAFVTWLAALLATGGRAQGRRLLDSSADADGCLRTIRALALHDSQLGAGLLPESSRMWQKWSAGAAADSASDFETQMAAQQSQGVDFVCHHSADWVAEVFVGLAAQWEQQYSESGSLPPTYAPGERFPDAQRLTGGQGLVEALERNRGSGAFLYQLEAGNDERDHEWLVEQLPREEGYRVYQSYMWAYSLRAWLSPNGTDLEALWDAGDIVYKQEESLSWVNTALLNATDGACNLSQVAARDCPEAPAGLDAWAAGVAAWDKEQALAAFAAAWERWGQGRVIPPDQFFGEYLQLLTEDVGAFLAANASTDAAVPQRYSDAFVELFGTTDFAAAAGAPLNASYDLLSYEPGADEPFAVFLRTYALPERESERAAACDRHAARVLRSLVPP